MNKLKSLLKNKYICISLILLIVLIIGLLAIPKSNLLIRNIFRINKNSDDGLFDYFVYDNQEELKTLLTINCAEGINTVVDETTHITYNCKGKTSLSLDLSIVAGINYNFTITPVGKSAMTKTFCITEEQAQNLVDVSIADEGNLVQETEMTIDNNRFNHIEYKIESGEWKTYIGAVTIKATDFPEAQLAGREYGEVFIRAKNSQKNLVTMTKKIECLNFPPLISLVNVSTTTSSIMVETNVNRLMGGKIYYYYKKSIDSNYTLANPEGTTDMQYTYTGLEDAIKYDIKVEAKNGITGTVERTNIQTISLEDLARWNVGFSDLVWSNGKANATATTTVEGFTIQGSKDGANWFPTVMDTSTQSVNISEIPSGTVVYARLWDGTNGSSPASKNVVDSSAPNVNIGLSENICTVKETIKATITLTDTESLVNTSACKYIFSSQSSAYGVNSTTWNNATAFTINTQSITLSNTTEGTYYLHVLSVDKVGNKKEEISVAIDIVLINELKNWRQLLNSVGISDSSYSNAAQAIIAISSSDSLFQKASTSEAVMNLMVNTTQGRTAMYSHYTVAEKYLGTDAAQASLKKSPNYQHFMVSSKGRTEVEMYSGRALIVGVSQEWTNSSEYCFSRPYYCYHLRTILSCDTIEIHSKDSYGKTGDVCMVNKFASRVAGALYEHMHGGGPGGVMMHATILKI